MAKKIKTSVGLPSLDITVPKKIRKFLIWGIIAAVIVLAVHYGRKKERAKNVLNAPLTTDYTTTEGGVVTLTTGQAQEVRSIAIALHSDMDGWALFTGHDANLYYAYAQFSDLLFSAVYYEFRALYSNDNQGSLTQWLVDEQYAAAEETVNDVIIPRLRALGLD